ncbi:MAG: hypothetical protein WC979_04255 [Candidatus Pacearchaeota archaeon]|jgi:cell division protein ZapA (FtsZ GTPase activity inhibitor)
METDKIRALFIYEVLGRPPEHIKAALEDFIDKLNSQKGIKVESKKIHEPTPCEDEHAKDLFTTFAEVELLIDNLNLLFSVVYNTLPASVEIIGPSEMNLKNFDLSSIITDLTLKLHKYDEVAKTISIEKVGLINVVKELQKEVERLKVGKIPEQITFKENIETSNKDVKKKTKKNKKNN